jgi:hypothetical protein
MSTFPRAASAIERSAEVFGARPFWNRGLTTWHTDRLSYHDTCCYCPLERAQQNARADVVTMQHYSRLRRVDTSSERHHSVRTRGHPWDIDRSACRRRLVARPSCSAAARALLINTAHLNYYLEVCSAVHEMLFHPTCTDGYTRLRVHVHD